MTATHHALTGAAIGLIVGQPILAIPLALVSHFILDAIPHFAFSTDGEKVLRTKLFRNYLIVEALLCFLIVCFLFASQPTNWLLAAICAFVAASPDFLHINKYIKKVRGQEWKQGWFSKFAVGIQWFQRPIGGVVEVAWCIAMIVIIAQFVV